MKILHIPNYYLPNYGGVQQVAYDIVTILKGKCEQKIICFSGSSETTVEEYEGVSVIRAGGNLKIFSQQISIKYFFLLKKLLKDYNPDYIHFHAPNPLVSIYLLWLLLFNDAKLIVHWHSDIVEQKKMYFFYRWLEKRMLKKAYKIIATSPNYIEDSHIANYKEKIEIVYNIVDEDKIKLDEEDYEKVQKIKNDYFSKKIVLFLGVHRKYKGLNFLIKSADYLPDNYVILIAGRSTNLTEELKKMSSNSKKIKFLENVSIEEKKIYLNVADIFAFPSITKNEAFGVALAEALYCGVPAVTFTIKGSGVNFVNQNKITGLEVENGNVLKFAKAIQEICENEIKYKMYSENAKKWVMDNFVSSKIKNKVFEIYSINFELEKK